ncbi:hypothetical protein KIPB_011035, partial [Kipferlia bialata]|eukprot:g11035.t1
MFRETPGGRRALARVKALCERKEGRELDLSHCSMGYDGCRALATPGCMVQTQWVTKFSVASNGISSDGVPYICTALRQMYRLSEVDLSCNSIQDSGVDTLVQALPALRGVTKLNLSSNDISPIGAVALADTLAKCQTVTE